MMILIQYSSMTTEDDIWSYLIGRELVHPKYYRDANVLQILSILEAFTTGLALEICSLPMPLKSKPQECCSGYR